MKRDIILRKEDFHDFPIGEFPYDRDHTAAGEYHYIVEEGYRGVWYDPVCNYTYNGTGPTWIITEYRGSLYGIYEDRKKQASQNISNSGNRRKRVGGIYGIRKIETSFLRKVQQESFSV